MVGGREGEDEPILGDPIGAEGLRADLAHEMIPYTPAELVAIAERELAWGEAEMRRAAQEMGFGSDWKAALEQELVTSGRMTARDVHDAILQGGSMPVEMVRARLLGIPPARNHSAQWRFGGG